MKLSLSTILKLALVVIFLVVTGVFASQFEDRVNTEEVARQLGWWGLGFLTIGVALGGIIVPLSAIPFLFVGLSLYGFWPTMAIYYLGNTLLAPAVDFGIARKLGRPAIRKLGGQSALVKIDQLAQHAGTVSLIVMRIFGGILFDSISYAMGLTKLKFTTYMLITALFPIPGQILVLYLIHKGLATNPLYFGLIALWSYSAGVGTAYYLYHKSKKAQS